MIFKEGGDEGEGESCRKYKPMCCFTITLPVAIISIFGDQSISFICCTTCLSSICLITRFCAILSAINTSFSSQHLHFKGTEGVFKIDLSYKEWDDRLTKVPSKSFDGSIMHEIFYLEVGSFTIDVSL